MRRLTSGDMQVESGVIISESISQKETEILNLVREGKTVTLEALSDRIDEVRHLISLSLLGLSVSAYPWGVHFNLGLSKRGVAFAVGIRKATDNPDASVRVGRELE